MDTAQIESVGIDARKILLALFKLIAGFVVVSIGIRAAQYVGHMPVNMRFDLDTENSIPSYFSAALTLAVAMLFGLIGSIQRTRKERFAWHWIGLAVIFAFLSLDEATAIHEALIERVRHLLNLGGFLYFAWVVPGLIFVAAMLIGYFKFLVALPSRFRHLLITAGALFIGGALGMEMVGAKYSTVFGSNNLGYQLLVSVEESFEMLGMAICLFALLEFLRWLSPTLQFTFLAGETAPASARQQGQGHSNSASRKPWEHTQLLRRRGRDLER